MLFDGSFVLAYIPSSEPCLLDLCSDIKTPENLTELHPCRSGHISKPLLTLYVCLLKYYGRTKNMNYVLSFEKY